MICQSLTSIIMVNEHYNIQIPWFLATLLYILHGRSESNPPNKFWRLVRLILGTCARVYTLKNLGNSFEIDLIHLLLFTCKQIGEI